MDDVKKTLKQTTIDSKNNGYINGGTDLPTERLYDEIKKTKKQFTSSDQNYMGTGGTEVAQPVDHNNYNNCSISFILNRFIILNILVEHYQNIDIIIINILID